MMERFLPLIKFMEPATVLIISVAAVLVAVTGFAVYLSFGPPSKQLADPFDEHED
jgi:PsbN protein